MRVNDSAETIQQWSDLWPLVDFVDFVVMSSASPTSPNSSEDDDSPALKRPSDEGGSTCEFDKFKESGDGYRKSGKFYKNTEDEAKRKLMSAGAVPSPLDLESEASLDLDGKDITKSIKRLEADDLAGSSSDPSAAELKRLRDLRRARFKLKKDPPQIDQLLEKEEIFAEDIESSWTEDKAGIPTGWLILAALLILVGGCWVGYDVLSKREGTGQIVPETQGVVQDQRKEDREVRALLVKMQDCVRGYLEAESLDAMLPYVRHPGRVLPYMKEYYKTHRRSRQKFSQFDYIRSMSIGDKSFVFVVANTEKSGTHHLFLEQFENGQFRVDWEIEVIYQPMPWAEYVVKRPVIPMDMRVKVQVDKFYGFAFRDEKKYQCYKLTTMGSDDYLFGYVERGSQAAKAIESLLVKLKGEAKGGGAGESAFDGHFLKGNDDLGSEELGVDGVNKDDREGREDALADDIPTLVVNDLVNMASSGDEKVKQKPEAMILRMRFLVEDQSERSVMIDGLVAEGWMYRDSPKPRP